jgi:hypothetical protein
MLKSCGGECGLDRVSKLVCAVTCDLELQQILDYNFEWREV